MDMATRLLYCDQYVEVHSDRIIVGHEARTDVFALADVQAVELHIEEDAKTLKNLVKYLLVMGGAGFSWFVLMQLARPL